MGCMFFLPFDARARLVPWSLRLEHRVMDFLDTPAFRFDCESCCFHCCLRSVRH